jgi:methyl-accepting chemotaxis protein
MAVQLSLRPLLIGAMALLLVCVVSVIVLLTIRSQESSNAAIQASFARATTSLGGELSQRLEAISASQAAAATATLDAKALSSARLIAGSVVSALVVSETESLNAACALIDQDPEMVVAIISDAKGLAASSYWPAKAKDILGISQLTQLATSIEALSAKGDIRIARAPIAQDGQRLGEVLIVATTSFMQKQLAVNAVQMKETKQAIESQLVSTQQEMVKELSKTATDMRWQIILAGLTSIVVASILFSSLASWIASPIRALVATLRRVSEGDYQTMVAARGTREITDMSAALSTTIGTLNTQRSGISAAAQALLTQATQMTGLAKDMSKGVAETSSQAEGAAKATEAVSVNINSVSAAAEEMATCVKEISINTIEAARIASEAMNRSKAVSLAMTRLTDSSQRIATVTTTIKSIADQTNLLALNATIEAARAGEAGRGFAVVANEVKELSRQSSSATTDIASMVSEIQEAVKASSEEILAVSGIIERINTIQSTVASAIEEQSATTNEMVRSLNSAANSSQEVAGSVNQVAEAAKKTTEGAITANTSASNLAKLADDLGALVISAQKPTNA